MTEQSIAALLSYQAYFVIDRVANVGFLAVNVVSPGNLDEKFRFDENRREPTRRGDLPELSMDRL